MDGAPPDCLRSKPLIRRVEGRWVVDAGNLGFVEVVFGCGPDNRGEWADLLAWPGWKPLPDDD